MTRRAALSLLAVTGLSGCSFTPIVWESPSAAPSTGASADPAVELRPDFFVQTSDHGTKTLDEGTPVQQRISTPHFDGWLESVFVGQRLGERTAAQVRQATEVRAPRGHEIVAFLMRAGRPSFLESTQRVAEYQLRVGATSIPVNSPFGRFAGVGRGQYDIGWVLFVFCVPVGAEVWFDVTDQDKTVTLDVRTGAPVDDEAWAATAGFRDRMAIEVTPNEGLFKHPVETAPPADIQKETGEFMLSLQPDAAYGLVPWTPETGWAPAGQQWLRIKMNARAMFTSQTTAFQMVMDGPGTFTYEDSAGASHPAALPETINSESIRRGTEELDVTWLVDGLDESAVVRCLPVGTMEAVYMAHPNIPAGFTGQPAAVEFGLTYTPLSQ